MDRLSNAGEKLSAPIAVDRFSGNIRDAHELRVADGFLHWNRYAVGRPHSAFDEIVFLVERVAARGTHIFSDVLDVDNFKRSSSEFCDELFDEHVVRFLPNYIFPGVMKLKAFRYGCAHERPFVQTQSY